MKANELMIGDWVIGCSGEPFKIGIVDPDFLYWNEIQPIPLTQEILEKNGFICDGWSWWYQDLRIVLSTSKGVSLVCGRQKRFEFVHQLQHALRLCDIEKEIEL